MDVLIWAYRYLFWCRRRSLDFFFAPEFPKATSHVSVSKLPWLWIGATTLDNQLFAVTDEVNAAVDYGDIVDRQFLENVTRITDAVVWKYLDPVELTEKDFPSEGFLIKEDDTVQQPTEESPVASDSPADSPKTE
jgi:hypothetical protein